MQKDTSTEEKIKEAAREIFQQKGYAATRTRDIAEVSGINLALLNYYFRSKEKLFKIVMADSFSQLFLSLQSILNDDTTLEHKIDALVNAYIDMLLASPNLPGFILSEMQANPDWFHTEVGINKELVTGSMFFRQMKEQMDRAGIGSVNPFHFVINMLAMTVFPFVGKPLVKMLADMNDASFQVFANERKTFVPMWIKGMLQM